MSLFKKIEFQFRNNPFHNLHLSYKLLLVILQSPNTRRSFETYHVVVHALIHTSAAVISRLSLITFL